MHRIADAAQAEVDHARARVHGPANGCGLGLERNRAVGFHDLGDQQLRRVRDADDAFAVEVPGDLARDERPVALGVDARVAADEALLVDDPSLEVRQRAVDARVDDRDLHRCERRRGLGPEVEGVIVLEVPLLRRERIGRRERSGRRRRCEGRDREDEHDAPHQRATIWGALAPMA